MGFAFKLEEYFAYEARVGGSTYIDITRRTDPARVPKVWENLEAVIKAYGAPWVAQLWTKDLTGAMSKGASTLEKLRENGTTLTCQLTATGLFGTVFEPNNTSSPFAGAEDFFELSGGPDHVKWRFDPIIPTVHRQDRFDRLAVRAKELGITRCVINFVAHPGRYKRVDARLAPIIEGWSAGMPGYDDDWKRKTARDIVATATDLGLEVAVCAESSVLASQVSGLHKAACGDRDWFYHLSGKHQKPMAGRGSRPGCGCAPYFDVGLYGQWGRCHKCLYCYAG